VSGALAESVRFVEDAERLVLWSPAATSSAGST
jgi:hypothetical protein